jgi:hypothetical protein
MREHFQPIDQLTIDWQAIGRGAESERVLRLLASQECAVASTGACDLHELVAKLRGAIGDQGGTWAPRVLQAMLRSGSLHPLIPRSILQAILPGLVTVARRLSWGSGGEWSDGGTFFSDLLTTAWEVINEWSGDDRPYALLDLLSAVRCRMRRQMVNGRAAKERPLGSDLDRQLTMSTYSGLSDLEVLANAIQDLSGSQLDPTDAAVLYGYRVLGLSMTEMARMTGRSRRFLADRKKRAEHQLCA